MPVSTLDAFRLELGDRDETAPLFNDNEAQYFIDNQPGSVLLAVADACDALARRFAVKVDTSITSGDDTVSRKYSSMAATYSDRATELRKRVQAASAPWHGGGSQSRKSDLASDPDRVQPRFNRGEFTSPHTGSGV